MLSADGGLRRIDGLYAPSMHSTTVARLLDEMQVERVAHESYSKKSFYGHGRSISLATVMAVVSIIGFMLRGGLAAPKP